MIESRNTLGSIFFQLRFCYFLVRKRFFIRVTLSHSGMTVECIGLLVVFFFLYRAGDVLIVGKKNNSFFFSQHVVAGLNELRNVVRCTLD